MQNFLGMFYSKKPRALQGIYDAPYLIMGRHAICAEGCAFDGGAAAVAIGRIRNAAEIRRALREEGIPLSPDGGISALLLGAYRMWGEACVEKLTGAVTCVVIDQDAGKLILSRDRMGENSVYYNSHGGSVCFAGHPSALLDAPGVSRVVDVDGWREVFGLGPARTPGRTPFRDILSLEPGCVLTADEKGVNIRKYFALEAREHADGLDVTLKTVRDYIERAVEDVKGLTPSSMLSGGVDSTVLTALISAMSERPVKTYSVDYQDNSEHFPDDNAYQPEQDSPWIDRAIKAIGCAHTRVVLTIDSLFDTIGEAMEARGLPGMADIDSSLLLFGRHIAESGRYVLSGECGDEVFGGYPWFWREDLINAETFPWSGSMQLRESVLRTNIRSKLQLGQYVRDRYAQSLEGLPVLTGEPQRDARLRQLHGLCFMYFMPNLQERAVYMLGQSGVNVLTPFCDDRLAQYVYNVPWDMKMLRGQEKGLMREAMSGLLPDALLWRKKSPYPKTYHPEYARLAIDGVRKMIADPAAPILQIADRDAISRMIAGPLSPTPWYGQLMAGPQMLSYLIQVNQWMYKYRVEVDI